ncbi:MAG: hypothetical protein H0U46_05125 [Actinobacteria bacterium]|nr:hypothetical protein [Actinomycetota bacterium]
MELPGQTEPHLLRVSARDDEATTWSGEVEAGTDTVLVPSPQVPSDALRDALGRPCGRCDALPRAGEAWTVRVGGRETTVRPYVPVRLVRPPGVDGPLWVRAERDGEVELFVFPEDRTFVSWRPTPGRWRIGVLDSRSTSAVVELVVGPSPEVVLPTPNAPAATIRGRLVDTERGRPRIDAKLALCWNTSAPDKCYEPQRIGVPVDVGGRFSVPVPDDRATYRLHARDSKYAEWVARPGDLGRIDPMQ